MFNAPVSLVLLDENEELLGAHVAKDEQWRFPESNELNHKFVTALLAYEDKRFWNHPGVDPIAILRAIRSNLGQQRIVSGASTISMQVVRLSRNNPKRTFLEKITELFRATRLELSYSKEEILKHYSSHAPFGGNVVGLQAASWKYFGKPDSQLSWAEATMLAVLPNAPGLIHPNRNRSTLLTKRNKLLHSLFEKGKIDAITYELSLIEPLPQKTKDMPQSAPHLVQRLLNNNQSGIIKSSINKHQQKETNLLLEQQIQQLQKQEINNASVLVIDSKTGKIKSYIGNTLNNSASHVDMITAKRSTGSILKPLLYLKMLEKGEILPHSLISDVPVNYNGYSPKNYNLKYEGLVSADEMVSRSLNIPAVNMLKQHGTHYFINDLKEMGFHSINENAHHYGLSLILGGAEVSPWELGRVYTNLSQTLNNTPNHFSYLADDTTATNINHDKTSIWNTFNAMLNTVRPNEDVSWRVFESSHKVAWKTGTSFGGRDAWAIGCNPDYTVIVWVGNADGTGRPSLTGYSKAAPILFDIFNYLNPKSDWFAQPESKNNIKICAQSGMRANKHCQKTNHQECTQKGYDSPECSFCKTIQLDKTGTFEVSGTDYSPFDRVEKSIFQVPTFESFYYSKTENKDESIKPSNTNIEIKYPENGKHIFLPQKGNGELSSVVSQVVLKEDIQLYWFLNKEYLGTTKGDHQMKLQPESGQHELLVLDEKGNKKKISFEVI